MIIYDKFIIVNIFNVEAYIMNGVYLQGGGAKGAFQAGVIYGLNQRGIKFNIISGTSIGAINGYYIYTDNIEKLKQTWLSIDQKEINGQVIKDKVIENEAFIEKLSKLKGRNEDVKDFYVNYINIKDSVPNHVVKNISNITEKEALDTIKYSSLLPYIGPINIHLNEAIKNFNSSIIFEQFEEELKKGNYNGYNLDGGILNNNFLECFIKNKVDRLFIIQFKKDYNIPEYILDYYNKEDIIVIEPNEGFLPGDTLRFEEKFCEFHFNQGYNIAKNIE